MAEGFLIGLMAMGCCLWQVLNTTSQLTFQGTQHSLETFDELSLSSSQASWIGIQALHHLFSGDISKTVSFNFPTGGHVLASLLATISPLVSSTFPCLTLPSSPYVQILPCLPDLLKCSLIPAARMCFLSFEFHSTFYLAFHAYHIMVS